MGVIGGGGNFEGGGGNPVGTSTESTRFSRVRWLGAGSQRRGPTNNNFTLDGVDNNEGSFGQIGIYPPPDSVSEFKIETSVAPAEGGRAGGGIINTTSKSGSNSVHGTLYEYYQGRIWSALSRSERTVPLHLTNRNTHQSRRHRRAVRFSCPALARVNHRSGTGATAPSGFVYYEEQRNATPSTTGDFGFVSVPTARMRVVTLAS